MSPLVTMQKRRSARFGLSWTFGPRNAYVTGRISGARPASFLPRAFPFLLDHGTHGPSFSSQPPPPPSLLSLSFTFQFRLFDSDLLHRSNAAPQGTRAMSHSSSLSHTDSPSPSLPDEGYDEQRIEIPKWVQSWTDEQRAGTSNDALTLAVIIPCISYGQETHMLPTSPLLALSP